MRRNSWRASFHWLMAAGLAAACSIGPSSADAASLQRLADGRVIVSAYGQRLAFREKDAERIEFLIDTFDCDRDGDHVATLVRWLSDPRIQAGHRLVDHGQGIQSYR
jgi:hypothetical protein